MVLQNIQPCAPPPEVPLTAMTAISSCLQAWTLTLTLLHTVNLSPFLWAAFTSPTVSP